jgi:hypothetical protein
LQTLVSSVEQWEIYFLGAGAPRSRPAAVLFFSLTAVAIQFRFLLPSALASPAWIMLLLFLVFSVARDSCLLASSGCFSMAFLFLPLIFVPVVIRIVVGEAGIILELSDQKTCIFLVLIAFTQRFLEHVRKVLDEMFVRT